MNESWRLQKKLSPLVGKDKLAVLENLVAPFVYGLRGPGAGGNSLFFIAKPYCMDRLLTKLTHYLNEIDVLFAKVNETGVQKEK